MSSDLTSSAYELELKSILGDEYDEPHQVEMASFAVYRKKRLVQKSSFQNAKRKGPYKSYTKEQVKCLFKCYFVDKMTVKEASKVCGVHSASSYKYIRRLKIADLPKIFDKGMSCFSRGELVGGLTDQMKALDLL